MRYSNISTFVCLIVLWIGISGLSAIAQQEPSNALPAPTETTESAEGTEATDSIPVGEDVPAEEVDESVKIPATSETAETVESTDTTETAASEETQAEITVVPNNNHKLLLNFKNATLNTILEHLSEVAGLVVISDVQIDDRLTVISRQPLSVEEAVSLINSVLIERNYAAIKMGRTLKIVPLEDAKQMNIPVRSGNDPLQVVPSDDIVTHVIPIRYASASQLQEELAPLIPAYANLTANAETNALVITDTTANIRRLMEIIQALDTHMSGVADVKVFRLKYSDATNTANLINDMFQADSQSSRNRDQGQNPFERMMSFRGGGRGGPGGRGGDRGRGDDSEVDNRARVVAAADSYTNTLVVSGPPDILRIVENLITELDSNPMEEQTVLIYPLQNAQAENLKEVLNNLFQQMQQMLTQGMGGIGGGRGGTGGRGGFGGFGGFGNRGGTSTLSAAAGYLVGQVYFEADTDTNSILAIAAQKHFDKIKSILEELDKPVPQVLIKVLIAEVTHDGSLDLGVEFSMLNLRDSGGSTSTITDFGIAAQSSGLIVQTLEGDLDVTVRALETQGKLDILSRPYILTSNNQTATITVGEEVPFIRNTRTTETGQTLNTIEYEDIGIILEVTPSINPEGLVSMDVRPEISTTTANTVPISETVNAAVFAKRSADSRVAIRNGQTIVIGGLVQDRETESVHKVPLLGDIPLLGLLFQRIETETNKTELLIFLTPYVALKDSELNDIADPEDLLRYKEHLDKIENGKKDKFKM